MKGRLQATVFTVIFLLATTGVLWASAAVRVVSDLEGTTANFNVSHNGADGEILNLSVPAISINTVTLDGREYKQVDLPVADYLFRGESDEAGKPNVPMLTTMLIIPDRAGVSLNVSYSGFDTFEDIDLAPVQPTASESDPQEMPFTLDNSTYSQDAFYPGDIAVSEDPAIMRDVRFTQICVYPVQYNPVRRELKVYRDLSVSVSYTNDNVVNPKLSHRQFISDGFYPLYKGMFSNFDEYLSTATVQRGGFVIIAKPALVDSLKAIARWKHLKGYTVRVVPTTEINSNGSPTSAQIYAFLDTAYHNWEVPPEYVMLVGDVDGTFIVNQWPYSGYTSDHHYTMLEGSDYIPDIFLSRLSLDNMAQFRIASAKILAYDSAPNMADTMVYHRELSVAGNIQSTTPRLITLWVRQLLFDYGYTVGDTVFDWGGGGGTSSILASMNRGVSVVAYRGWAGSSGWYNPPFNTSNLNSVTNTNKLGIMTSIVCGTGDFGDTYTDPCFGETWVTMGASPTSFKGGPAFYGITDHSTHTPYNNPNMVGFYAGVLFENTYHFAAAAVRGKMQIYKTFPRANGSGSVVERYFHTCNMLGDPEVEVRTRVPITLMVSHPDTLALGVNHIEITVTDSSANPISGAFVTLVKGYGTGEEVFRVGKTDETGNIAMSFAATTADTMFLTVSGRDLYPYKGLVQIIQSDLAVGYDSLTVDDGSYGFSHGNADGVINPGEIINLDLILKNFGVAVTARDVQAQLEAIDPELVTILDARRGYGDIAPGELSYGDQPFLVKISDSAIDGELARIKLSVTDSSGDFWYSVIELPVISPRFTVSAVAFQDGNSRLDPGDSLSLVITLNNGGNKPADGVEGVLSSKDDYTQIISGNAGFGHIGVDSAAAGSPMVIKCSAEAFNGRTINLMLDVTTLSGEKSAVPFAVTAGAVTTRDPLGPDAYGYYLYDDTDTSYSLHPTYQWVEINSDSGGAGSRLNYGSNTDDKSVLVTLPFNFTYYGRSYDYMIVCTNGFTAFDTTRFDMAGDYYFFFFNWPIPDPGGAAGQISPFWDDLRFTGTHVGVYTWNDSTNHRFIVEWSAMTNVNSSQPETFEMIMMDPQYYPTVSGDGEIYFQYRRISNTDSQEGYASIGLESPDQQTGLQYTYCNYYAPTAPTIAANRAMRITTTTGRGGIRGTVSLGGSEDFSGVKVSASSGQFRITPQSGSYWITNVPPGVTSVNAEIDGYFPHTIDSVTINVDQTTGNIDFSLVRCPVPANLIASDTLANRVEVRWDSVGSENLAGYNVYRSQWETGDIEKLNDTPLQARTFTDTTAADSITYWYCVAAAYAGANWNAESFVSNKDAGGVRHAVGIAEENLIPKEFFLSQNYPNPFNPTTLISYGLPKDSDVKVQIFNLLGQRVITLVSEHQTAGLKSVVWDGKDGAGKSVTSGVYFYRIDTGDHQDTKKMLLLK